MNYMKTKFSIRDNTKQDLLLKFYRGSATRPLSCLLLIYLCISENLQIDFNSFIKVITASYILVNSHSESVYIIKSLNYCRSSTAVSIRHYI